MNNNVVSRGVFAAAVIGVLSSSPGAWWTDAEPRITSFKIASGSFNTAERTVKLDIRVDGATPIAYRASEKPDLSGALWKAFETYPNFVLSSGQGQKIVFVQVGSGNATTVSAPRTGTTISAKIGDYVPAPPIVSTIARDTIVLGLPDLTATVQMPSQVKDGDHRAFDFGVTVKNNGQMTPPGEVIHLYNSFVLDQLAIESFDVTFGVSRLVGDGCRITDTPTIECTLAPIPPGGATQLNVRASVTRLLSAGQTQASPTLRTRIYGVRESNTTNNWVDTPLNVVK